MIVVKRYCPVRPIIEKISRIDSSTAFMQRSIAHTATTKET
jgi:hypothetical protein